MKPKQILRISIDIIMTVLFLVLMAYHITGNSLHEWLGMMLFLLFILHHILNRKWVASLLKGRYSAARILMVFINLLLFAAMLGMMVSGILLSREVFGFLNMRAGMLGRRLHMVSTAWGYLLMSAHLGLHWGMIMGLVKQKMQFKSKLPKIIGNGLLSLITLYGIYAFINRQLADRMFLMMEYAFFDYEEPAVFFFVDYISIMVLFAAIAHYVSFLIRKHKRSEGS